jgi:hypothetical protein
LLQLEHFDLVVHAGKVHLVLHSSEIPEGTALCFETLSETLLEATGKHIC